ncbi:NTP transferase domain-containing protein [Streptomyces sp. B3I8]|uniref:NTP transferase domain-containing protein n=1 Tax=Streptomyces sp. B3I8 TaxID=3042303 RepID=UPI0027829D96|nr:NTP transferase domain-containing protein [Streptomyces sp. B3I8]MDQ0788095.1 molybdopterin-guanine dinucleotide biosynthesis protein A [Streptomyces sp. B3I8]
MTAYQQPAADAAGAFDAVVLAGGAARRLGGADKPGVRVGGRALLDRVLSACADAAVTVVVADPRPTARPVRWACEEPPGGGPVAALDAGLRHTTAPVVVVLSADLPFLGMATVRRLTAALAASGAEGALLSDAEGRDQPLVAAYRADALRRALDRLATEHTEHTDRGGHGGPHGAGGHGEPPGGRGGPGEPGGHGALAGLSLRRLTGALRLTRAGDPVASFDCDTWDDIAAARARIREHGHVLDEWITAVKDELGIELDVDTGVLLDLARDAAHGVARPAAPLTTFLAGYAAGRAGGGPEAVAEAARKAAALALRWVDEDAGAATGGVPAATGTAPAAGDAGPTAADTAPTATGAPGAATGGGPVGDRDGTGPDAG